MTSPLRSIRLKCIECSGDSFNEVKLCVIPSCPLYPFRLGKNPNRRRRILTEAQKEKMKAGRTRVTKAT
jgi:hypothetical protein